MSEPATAAVELSGLTRRFGEMVALDGLTLSVAAGEIFGLVGPDGAGKTTAIRMMAGILPPDAGSIAMAGCDVVRDPESVKRYLSYMPQRFGLYEDLTVDENLRFYADVFGLRRRERTERGARLLQACGMSEVGARLAGNLSGGMKQKLGLACALIHTPKILLLDEPTNGVDPISRREFWEMLEGLAREGVTIIVSTAYLDEAERCHRIALLDHGRVLFCDTPARLKERVPFAVVAIVSAQARRVREELSAADGVAGAALMGDAVHLYVDDAARRIPELETRMRAASLEFDEIERIAPTIEDLFVSAVSNGNGG